MGANIAWLPREKAAVILSLLITSSGCCCEQAYGKKLRVKEKSTTEASKHVPRLESSPDPYKQKKTKLVRN